MPQDCCLVLENGQCFHGKSFGAPGEVTGEIVFTTAMTGYLETLTDPSYYGQMVVQTFPLIGNYGVIPSDFENPHPALKAYIVREWCQSPSNFRAEGDLDAFLKGMGIVSMYDIDTRELTKIIREHGVMNAKIVTGEFDMQETLREIAAYRVGNAVMSVTCRENDLHSAHTEQHRVVLWDFGAKANIHRELVKRGCEVVTVPASTSAQEIIKLSPDGIMLSNGPGDPADNQDIIKELAKVCQAEIPLFGICLGHQLLAISQGAKTSKLKYGHRGANQPVKDLLTGRVYITSQNHGYAVVGDTLPDYAVNRYINANDKTCEGISYKNMPAFSVQFHPEASAGPLDTGFLFDEFISLIEEETVCR